MIILDLKDKVLLEQGKAEKVYWMHYSIKHRLTPVEIKLLLALSNNVLNTYDEIKNFAYGTTGGITKNRVITALYRLKEKYKLNIVNVRNKGYRLDDEIFIDY